MNCCGFRLGLAVLSLAFLSPHLRAQESPRGSITIDRIADIKYPTDQLWSPDNKSVAFLWDAAGKQDLFVSQGSGPPIAAGKLAHQGAGKETA